MGEKRRTEILKQIANSTKAISASTLAKQFNVSRQVIVGDVALLRAQGHPIKATAKGYVMFLDEERFIAKVAVDHLEEDTEAELKLLIDMDVYILDVTVDHPIYGEITGQLNIRNDEDIQNFMNDIKNKETELLSSLTKGVHLHTISCESKKHYELALDALKEKGWLIENN